jgi:flagellar L-ring protein precursor FlgH
MHNDNRTTQRSIRLTVLALAVATALAHGLPTAADSLYVAGKSQSMFSARKARGVGDVITVLITETTIAVQDADTDVQKKLDARAEGGSGLYRRVPKATLGGSTTHRGSGSTSRSSRLISTITCRVIDITPGGHLVIQGDRTLKVNADTQTMKLSGVVRPEDVDFDNTIPSGAVADARIEVLGKGPIDRHVKPGLLTRIFEFLF